jgi:hypothetical protein
MRWLPRCGDDGDMRVRQVLQLLAAGSSNRTQAVTHAHGLGLLR